MESIFTIPDYIVFALVVLVSLAIGAYFTCANKTTEAYLVGGRKLKVVPVGISLMIGYVSAITVIGCPAEIYYFGAEYWFFIAGYTLAILITYFLFVPLFYPLRMISVHEYILMRFKKRWMVYIGTFIQCLTQTIYNGIVLFGPATLIANFSGISTWLSMLVMAFVAIIYTTVGGIKAAIWSSVFQAVIVLGGLLATVVLGAIDVGGFKEVFSIYSEAGRGSLRWTADMTVRSTVWSYVFGMGLFFTFMFSCLQMSVQRFSSMPNMEAARRTLLVALPSNYLITSLACMAGVVAFAYYSKLGCDPLRAGVIENPNQIIPQFIRDVLRYPAVPGLFTASLFCSTVSTLSSTFNSCAALIWVDILKDKLEHLHLIESRKSAINKILTAVVGLGGLAAGFCVSTMGGTLFQMLNSINSCLYTPLSVVIVLGAVSPRSSWKSSALAGAISFIFIAWLTVGGIMNGRNSIPLPTDTNNCSTTLLKHLYVQGSHGNTTDPGYTVDWETSTPASAACVNQTDHMIHDQESFDEGGTFFLFRLSFLWYYPIGLVIGILLGLVFTYIPGLKTEERVELKLLFPCVRSFVNDSEYVKYEMDEKGSYVAPGVDQKNNTDT